MLDIVAIIGFSTVLEPLWGLKEFLVSVHHIPRNDCFTYIHAFHIRFFRALWVESVLPQVCWWQCYSMLYHSRTHFCECIVLTLLLSSLTKFCINSLSFLFTHMCTRTHTHTHAHTQCGTLPWYGGSGLRLCCCCETVPPRQCGIPTPSSSNTQSQGIHL